jgi:hypothetical protein
MTTLHNSYEAYATYLNAMARYKAATYMLNKYPERTPKSIADEIGILFRTTPPKPVEMECPL